MATILLNRTQIGLAIRRADAGLTKYSWLQEQLHRGDVTKDAEFQRRFNGFYRIRRNREWRDVFFRLLEEQKTRQGSFGDALGTLWTRTGRVEASFASKLVATVAPSNPVIDSLVLRNLGLRLPARDARNRIDGIVELHDGLVTLYDDFLKTAVGRHLVQRFNGVYPENRITDVKKLDLVLWKS